MLGRLMIVGVIALALIVIVTQSGRGDAAQATIAQSCPSGEAGGVTVSFVWPAAAGGATQTFLDVGLDAAFTTGQFQGYGPFDPALTAYALAGLPEGVRYHYRVQSLVGAEWKISARGSFTTACGVPPEPGDVTQRCLEGPQPGPADDGVSANFAWKAGAEGEQWVDVTVQPDAFVPEYMHSYGPAASGTGALQADGLARDTRYWWRVNVRTPGGWITSETKSFTTLPCPR